MAIFIVAALALVAPQASAGGFIDVPRPLSFPNGQLLFLSNNGGTGNLSALMPAPARGSILSTDNHAKAFSFHNDDARSLRLINVKAPLTIRVCDDTVPCDDAVIRDSKPRALIFIRQSGTYTIPSFEGGSQGPVVRIPLQGGGVAFSNAVTVIKTGRGQLDGKVSAIVAYGFDRGNDQAVYP
jgi:hypothetical protein